MLLHDLNKWIVSIIYLNGDTSKSTDWSVGEMAQSLQTLAALPENPCKIPSSHMAAHNSVQMPAPGNPIPSPGPWAPSINTNQ